MTERKSLEDYIADEFRDGSYGNKYRYWYPIPAGEKDSPVQATDFRIEIPRRVLSVDALFRIAGHVNATEIAGIPRGHLLFTHAEIYKSYARGRPRPQVWTLSFMRIRGREWNHPDFTQPPYAELRELERQRDMAPSA